MIIIQKESPFLFEWWQGLPGQPLIFREQTMLVSGENAMPLTLGKPATWKKGPIWRPTPPLKQRIIQNENKKMGVSKNRGTPKWMVKMMENPIKMDDLRVPLFSETPKCINEQNKKEQLVV